MITIKNERFTKMYWDLSPYCKGNLNALLLINYIIDVYDTLKERYIAENNIEYRRLSNSFIKERINWKASKTFRDAFNILKESGLIDYFILQANERERWVHLNVEVEDNGTDHGNEYGNNHGNNHGTKITINQTNKLTNQHTNIDIDTKKETKKEEFERRIEEIKRDNNVPLLEEVIKFIKEDMKCTWKTEEDIIDFYNSTLFRGWKKASGVPITEWHSYFKWFAEHDKPKQVFDQDLIPDNKDKIDQWRKEI